MAQQIMLGHFKIPKLYISEEFSWAKNENKIFLLALTAKAGQRMLV